MAVRHWADHITTETGDEVRIEIHDANFGGTATKLKGTGSGWMRDELQKLNPRVPLEDPVQKRTVSATVWVNDSSLINDLFSAQEGRFSLVYHKNSSQEWTGDILPDLCSYVYLEDDKLWKLTVVAKDFSSLEGSSYGFLSGRQTPISIIADILSGLDIYTHTSWIVDGTTTANDFLRQVYLDRYALRTYARTGDESDESITKLEALRRVLRSCGAVLRQVSGRYYIQQLTALADAENVFESRYNSSGIFQGSSTVDLTTNVKVLTSSGFNHNPGIKSVRAKYDHRTEVSGIQFPTGLVVDGDPYEDDQFFQSDGSQTISFSSSRVEVLSTQNNGDMFINVVINPAGYYWSSSGWVGIPASTVVPLTNVGPHPTLADTYIWRGSVDIVTTPVPSDADGTLTVSVSKPLLSIQAQYTGNSFKINNDIASRNSTFIDYQITQLGEQSVRVDYGDTYFGDGPTGYSKGAFTLESDGSGLTADDWARRGESAFLNHHNNLLRETIDVQRTTRLRISGVVKSSVEWLDVPVFDGYSLFMLGGTFDGYTGVTTPEMLEINIQTAENDTFEDIPKFANEGSSGSSGSGSSGGGGIDQGTADARYFKQGSNLSEGNASIMRSNLGLIIGTDVQAWDAQLDTLSGLSAPNATKITQVTGSEWDIVREIDTIVEVSNPLLATSSPTFAGITTGSIKDASGNVLEFDGSGNVSIPGNLEVLGETFYAHVTNIEVEDPLMLLAKDNSTTALDIGFIGERGGLNIGSIWDESNDEFAFIFTNDDATTAGNVSIDSYADLRVNALKAGDATLSSLATNGGIVYTDSSGKLANSANATLDGDGNADFRGIKIHHIGSHGANDTVYILLLNEDSTTGGIQGDFYISRYNNAMTANKISVVAKKQTAAPGFSGITGTILSLTQTESPSSNTTMVSVLYEGKRYLALKGYRNQNIRFVGTTSYNIIAVTSDDISDEQAFIQTGSVYTGSSFEANSYKVGSNTVIDSSRNFTGVNATFSGTLGVGGVATFEDDIAFKTKIESDNYLSGILGTGAQLNNDATGGSFFEVDNMRVRNELRAHIFKKDIVKASNGFLFITDAAEIAETVTITGTSDTFKIVDDGTNATFDPGTLLWAKNISDDGSLQITGVKITVGTQKATGTTNGKDWIEYNITAVENGGTLNAGDTIVRVSGGYLMNDATTQYSPFLDVYDGVSSWSEFQNTDKLKGRFGNLEGVSDASGYGIYTQNAFLTGSLLVGDLTKAGNYIEYDTGALTGVFDSIEFDSDTFVLTAGDMVIDSTNGIELAGGDKWLNDGDFQFGGANGITYDGSEVGIGSNVVIDGANLTVQSLPRVSDDGLEHILRFNGSTIDSVTGDVGIITGSDNYENFVSFEGFRFDGSTRIESTVPTTFFNSNNEFTITGWFNVDTVGVDGNNDAQALIFAQNPSASRIYLAVRNGNVQLGIGSNSWTDNSSTVSAETNHFVEVYVNKTEGKAYLYLDSVFIETKSFSWTDTSETVYFGQRSNGAFQMTGTSGQWRFYNRALTSNERKSLYLYPSGNSGGLISADTVVATEAFFNELTSYNATINGILTVGQEIKSATAGAYSLTDDKVSLAGGIITADANSVGLANFNVTANQISSNNLNIISGADARIKVGGSVTDIIFGKTNGIAPPNYDAKYGINFGAYSTNPNNYWKYVDGYSTNDDYIEFRVGGDDDYLHFKGADGANPAELHLRTTGTTITSEDEEPEATVKATSLNSNTVDIDSGNVIGLEEIEADGGDSVRFWVNYRFTYSGVDSPSMRLIVQGWTGSAWENIDDVLQLAWPYLQQTSGSMSVSAGNNIFTLSANSSASLFEGTLYIYTYAPEGYSKFRMAVQMIAGYGGTGNRFILENQARAYNQRVVLMPSGLFIADSDVVKSKYTAMGRLDLTNTTNLIKY